MPAEYATAYATARSCLATLADTSIGTDEFRFARLLLKLDALHDPNIPVGHRLVGRRRDLLLWLEIAVERMIALGGDSCALELVLADALEP